ncbi:MAG: TlpA family protein disulfide reductase [Gemmatimonadetes bacterium]|nr:TlpA family protein disulfide reductase [Gemmatimonadota bacterium]
MRDETLYSQPPAPRRSEARRRRRAHWWPVAGALLLLGLLLFLGWGARERFLPVEVGTRAPDFAARDLDGAPVSLGELRGEVVLLNVWATWCPPCIEEMPSMQRLHERLGPEGLRVVAVSVDAAPGARDAVGRPGGNVRTFVDEFGITFDIWRDSAGEIQRIYRTTGIPESFVIDRDGVIIKKVIGATEWDAETNIELIRRLLRGS